MEDHGLDPYPILAIAILSALSVGTILPSSSVLAQEPRCRFLCSMSVQETLSLGDAAGGVVSFNPIIVEINDEYFVSSSASPQQVQVFDSTGRFARTIGSPGQGPAEFRGIADLLEGPDSTLWVVDQGNLSLKTFTTAGDLLSTTPLPLRPTTGTALVLPDSSLILNGMVPTPSLVGFWTHRWHPRKGLLWSSPGTSTLARRRAEARHYVVHESTLFVAHRTEEYTIEQVDLETGKVLEVHHPRRGWFDEWQETTVISGSVENHDALASPIAWITDLQIVEGRLWVLGYTADRRWEKVNAEGYRNLGAFLDNVVDVYDFTTMELLVSDRFDVDNTLMIAFLDDRRVFGHRTNPIIDHLPIFRVRSRGAVPGPFKRSRKR